MERKALGQYSNDGTTMVLRRKHPFYNWNWNQLQSGRNPCKKCHHAEQSREGVRQYDSDLADDTSLVLNLNL